MPCHQCIHSETLYVGMGPSALTNKMQRTQECWVYKPFPTHNIWSTVNIKPIKVDKIPQYNDMRKIAKTQFLHLLLKPSSTQLFQMEQPCAVHLTNRTFVKPSLSWTSMALENTCTSI